MQSDNNHAGTIRARIDHLLREYADLTGREDSPVQTDVMAGELMADLEYCLTRLYPYKQADILSYKDNVLQAIEEANSRRFQPLTSAEEIKSAVAAGNTVYWSNKAYQVVLDSVGQYLIKCLLNGACIGLTWADGETLNGRPEDFFIED